MNYTLYLKPPMPPSPSSPTHSVTAREMVKSREEATVPEVPLGTTLHCSPNIPLLTGLPAVRPDDETVGDTAVIDVLELV